MGNDAVLEWRPVGASRGSVALLHGMMSSSATWWQVGPELASRGWYVVALDLPAHGAVPRGSRSLDLPMCVASVLSRVPQPLHLLVGHSLGVATALAAAQQQPTLARALVLEEPPGPLHGQIREEVVAGIEEEKRLAAADRDQLIRRETYANPRWDPGSVQRSVDAMAAADVPSIAAGLRGPLGWDIPGMLRDVAAPVLMLVALDAEPPPVGSSLRGQERDSVKALLPANRFVVLPGGHCLHRDDPDRWVATVAAFADELLPPLTSASR